MQTKDMKKDYEVAVLDPAGNVTAIVLSDVPAAERARVLAQNLPAAPLDDAIAHADYRLLQLEETIRAGIERLEAEN